MTDRLISADSHITLDHEHIKSKLAKIRHADYDAAVAHADAR